MSSESDSEGEPVPLHILKKAEEATNKSLPPKSREKYWKVYGNFQSWRQKNKVKKLNESVFLAYFNELSEAQKPSTCWSIYSMLKSTLNAKEKINLHDYPSVVAFLKQNGVGYKSKKSKIFTPEDIDKFLKAPDHQYLVVKVAMAIGLSGLCRRVELTNIRVTNIDDKGDMLVITIPDTKNHRPQSFLVGKEFYGIYKKYAALRPPNCPHDRFFINYQNGKCTKQVIGVNKVGAFPKMIATYLNLPEPEKYTGHSFRRTSATFLADQGADNLTLKRAGNWRSDSVAGGYVENSLHSKQKVFNLLKRAIIPETSTSVDAGASASSAQHSESRTSPLRKRTIIPETQQSNDSDFPDPNTQPHLNLFSFGPNDGLTSVQIRDMEKENLTMSMMGNLSSGTPSPQDKTTKNIDVDVMGTIGNKNISFTFSNCPNLQIFINEKKTS